MANQLEESLPDMAIFKYRISSTTNYMNPTNSFVLRFEARTSQIHQVKGNKTYRWDEDGLFALFSQMLTKLKVDNIVAIQSVHFDTPKTVSRDTKISGFAVITLKPTSPIAATLRNLDRTAVIFTNVAINEPKRNLLGATDIHPRHRTLPVQHEPC